MYTRRFARRVVAHWSGLVYLEVKLYRIFTTGTELFFCCLSCLHEFLRDPQRFLDEVAQIFVCPVCLAEKPRHQGVTKIVESLHITFCRCSHCYYTFLENPEYYVSRLKADYGEGPTTWVATCC